MHQYSYFIGVIILGFIWLTFFFLRKDLRKQQLTMSILTAPLAPISQLLWFSKDYWNPEYLLPISINGIPIGIEEPLFAFFVGGIGTILYETIRKRTYQREKMRPLLSLFLVLITVGLFLFLKSIDINTIWASSLALIMGGLLMIIIDRDLIWDAIFSSIFFVLIAFIVYIFLLLLYPDLFAQLWINKGLSGINIFTIPIEEVVWFFSWGMFSGVIYEFWINVKSYQKLKTKN